eukprot:3466100-Amphidinium_carterae.1
MFDACSTERLRGGYLPYTGCEYTSLSSWHAWLQPERCRLVQAVACSPGRGTSEAKLSERMALNTIV